MVQGSVRQRSKGSYEVRVYLSRDLLTGKQRYATRTVRGGKRDAQRIMREMLTAADTGKLGWVDTTVGHLLERWFEQAQTDFSPNTVTDTRAYLDRTLLPGLGHLPLAKLGAADLDRFYLQLRTNGGPTSQPQTAATISTAPTWSMSPLRSFATRTGPSGSAASEPTRPRSATPRSTPRHQSTATSPTSQRSKQRSSPGSICASSEAVAEPAANTLPPSPTSSLIDPSTPSDPVDQATLECSDNRLA